MDEKILVPLDGSKVSEAALTYVEELLTKLSPEIKTDITLLQVLSQSAHLIVAGGEMAVIPYNEKKMETIKEKAIDYLNKSGEDLRSKGAIVTARAGVGDPCEDIIKAAEEINADLIAMSTHGRSGLSRWAFGSVTDKVLRHESHIPITMVRASR